MKRKRSHPRPPTPDPGERSEPPGARPRRAKRAIPHRLELFDMTRSIACLAALCLAAPVAMPQENAALRGYAADSARAERDWEAKFRAIPDPANLRAYMQRLTARPHHVGSPYDKDNAEWILAKLKEWGLDAQIETFDVLFPTPKERLLEMVAPSQFTAKLEEPTVAGDPTSGQHERAAAHVQRLLDRWRRDGAAGLRELRRAGRLRAARPAGHLREGRHRDRALRRVLARHQAEGGGGARRGRLPDLFRPARRRLRATATCFPSGPYAPQGRRAARQRDGHAASIPATR